MSRFFSILILQGVLSCCFLCTPVPSFSQFEQTKWTALWSQSQFYGGVASDLAPITLQKFGWIDSVWLESVVAFKLFDMEKLPLFTGLGAHFRIKPSDTGFQSGITFGWGWSQQTQKINFYVAGTIRF